MPSLGADMVAGTLVEWRVQPGDQVSRGQVIAEVDTEKGAVEIEVFETGEVVELLVEPGTKVPVGTPLAMIRGSGAAVREPAPGTPATPPPSSGARAAGRRRVSPLARRRAEELGVDLETVVGSGPEGAVVLQDVEAGVSPPPDRQPAMRRAIAAAMSRSKREIPHYYLATEVDAGPLLSWLTSRNANRAPAERLLAAAPLLRAVTLALARHPTLNGRFTGQGFEPSRAIHLGVAISLRQGGLVAPAIHDALDKSVEQLMAALSDLIGRVRSGSVRSSELSDPTVTVTSLGETGVPTVFGVIFPPQVAIVGLGRITTRPWVVGGQVVPRPVLTATLAADHRVSDGHEGARFLATLEGLLAEPERL